MTQIFLAGRRAGCWYRDGEPKMGSKVTGKDKF